MQEALVSFKPSIPTLQPPWYHKGARTQHRGQDQCDQLKNVESL